VLDQNADGEREKKNCQPTTWNRSIFGSSEPGKCGHGQPVAGGFAVSKPLELVMAYHVCGCVEHQQQQVLSLFFDGVPCHGVRSGSRNRAFPSGWNRAQRVV
jgi:hypothetical protein